MQGIVLVITVIGIMMSFKPEHIIILVLLSMVFGGVMGSTFTFGGHCGAMYFILTFIVYRKGTALAVSFFLFEG
ncbi:hypothetical protein [Paenibacillus sp. OSY-SE]|uniref:hypothetical protein n=1 Tax=Paenibacillus sp. OSY-SE TaxID=1196323 RepID=UPI0002DBECEA|nr:hypothetical protein [Paenibacillus sp. OSY-SE]